MIGWANTVGNTPSGALSVNVTVYGSVAVIDAICAA